MVTTLMTKFRFIKKLVKILNEALSNLNTICTDEKKKEIKEKTTNEVKAVKETKI